MIATEPLKPDATDKAFPLLLARCVVCRVCGIGVCALRRKHMAFDAPTLFLNNWKRRQMKRMEVDGVR